MLQPAKERVARAQTGLVGYIPKGAVAVVAKQHVAFVGEIGDHDVRAAVIIVVAEIGTHSGKGLSVLVVAHAGQQAGFRKGAIPVVVVEKTLY